MGWRDACLAMDFGLVSLQLDLQLMREDLAQTHSARLGIIVDQTLDISRNIVSCKYI